jgi:D-aspartate ligase
VRPVVVVGGYTPGLAVVRALGPHGVPTVVARYDKRDMAQASKWVHEVVNCPHPEHDEPAFVEFLVGLADRYPGAMLVPASDRALVAVAGHADRLAGAGYLVAAPSEWTARTCLDKSATYALAERSGVPSPKTVAVSGISDIEGYAAIAGANAGFPAVLKPTVSHLYCAVFGRKWTRVDSPEHAIKEYLRADEAGLEVVLQELIPGDELCGANYNAYFWGGQPLVEMTAVKIRNSPVSTGSPSVVVSRELPELLAPGRRMLRALDFHGFANIEFKRDPRDGQYKIIEVNARHNLSALLAVRCGVNFPLLQYRHLVHGELPDQPQCRQGVYWIDVTRDAKDAMSYLRRAGYSVGRFLRPYLAPHVTAVWDVRDPGPAAVRAGDTAKSMTRLTVRGRPAAVRRALRGGTTP